jgi:simple sugar transport system permease protein
MTRLPVPVLGKTHISINVVIALVVLGIAMFVLHRTRFGRTIYAMGGNEHSARLMGLRVGRNKVLIYGLAGFCSALAGVCYSVALLSGHGLYASGLELDVIASVVIGGTLLTGGVGYVFGTLFGVLITGLIQNLIMFNGQLSSWWTRIAIGALTLIFIGVQSERNGKTKPVRRLLLRMRPGADSRMCLADRSDGCTGSHLWTRFAVRRQSTNFAGSCIMRASSFSGGEG